MNIDTLLRLLSISFNIFKNNIKTVAPLIILYGMGLAILLVSFPYFLMSNNILDISIITFIQVVYQVILIKYIFMHLEKKDNNLINISEIINLSFSIFLLEFIIVLLGLLLDYIIPSYYSITVLLLIVAQFLSLFVIYIMIDKKESLQNSIIHSAVLTINNIGSILLFVLGSILLFLFFGFIMAITSGMIGMIIGDAGGLLLVCILVPAFYYFILIWFTLFYFKLSDSQ